MEVAVGLPVPATQHMLSPLLWLTEKENITKESKKKERKKPEMGRKAPEEAAEDVWQ